MGRVKHYIVSQSQKNRLRCIRPRVGRGGSSALVLTFLVMWFMFVVSPYWASAVVTKDGLGAGGWATQNIGLLLANRTNTVLNTLPSSPSSRGLGAVMLATYAAI